MVMAQLRIKVWFHLTDFRMMDTMQIHEGFVLCTEDAFFRRVNFHIYRGLSSPRMPLHVATYGHNVIHPSGDVGEGINVGYVVYDDHTL